MKRSVLLAVVAMICTTLFATNYYCSPSGLGSGNSYNDPCSFTDGVKKLTSAGDTLFCLGGQYDFSAVINITLTGGTAAKNLVICNYPGEQPVLDWRREAYGERGLVIKSTTNYLTVKGLTLRYTGKNAILNNGSYCTFENLDVYGNGDTGIQMKGGGYNYIINCDSHDNCDYKLGGLTAADFGGNADGFADKQFTGGPNTYIGCRAWNNSDDGWDFFQRVTSGTTPSVLQNCVCYNNGPVTYDMTNHGRYETDKAWFDQFLTEITITDADGNRIKASLAKYPNIGNGNGFKMGGGYTNNAVALYHCLAVANRERGFDQNNNYGDMTVYNSSAYMNGTDYGFGTAGGGSLVIKNCISYKNTYSFRVPTTESNNSWSNNNLKAEAADFVSLDTTQILSPRKTDGSLPDITFMHLQADSKFIDAGANVGLSYEGNAPDLGCYEYGSTNNYPATLTCTSGNLTQSIKLGNSIEPLAFKWGGSATDAMVDNLPEGLSSQKDESLKTVTISGTPTTLGTHTFSVTATGNNTEITLSASIVVKDNSAIEIAYVTLPGSDADQPILNKLNSNEQFSVNILDATNASYSYDNYQLIIISPVPNSTAAAMAGLEGIDKPTLLLKPFMLKNTVWNWGNSQNSNNSDMLITEPEHDIFKGLTLNSNQLNCFSSVNTNGVTYIANWFSATEPVRLATPLGIEGSSIAEIPVSTDMNGTVVTQRFLMIGVSEYSTANLTADALQLIENSCYYLLNLSRTPIRTQNSEYNIKRQGNELIINSETDSMQLYDAMGRLILKTESNRISTEGLPQGLYIIRVNNQNIKVIL